MKVILEMTGGPLRDGETLEVNYPYSDSSRNLLAGTHGARVLEPLGVAVVTRTYQGISHVKTITTKLEVSP